MDRSQDFYLVVSPKHKTRYLNQRSQLRRIGVTFPEFEKPKPKEAPMQRPTINNNAAAPSIPSNQNGTATTPKAPPDAATAIARVNAAVEMVDLAYQELRDALKDLHPAIEPLVAMGELVKRIRG